MRAIDRTCPVCYSPPGSPCRESPAHGAATVPGYHRGRGRPGIDGSAVSMPLDAPRYLVTELGVAGIGVEPPGGFVTELVIDPARVVMEAIADWASREVVAVCTACSKPVSGGHPNACDDHPDADVASLLLSRQEPQALVTAILCGLGMGAVVVE